MTRHCGVVVPIRSFEGGKTRLAARLDARGRRNLLERMASRVVTAAGASPLVVVTSAPEVVRWARGLDLAVVADPGTLDGAADAGRRHFRDAGAARVAVVHADLPLVETLEPLVAPRGAGVAVLAPCHRGDGTPALSVPAAVDFRFAYGPGSIERHREEARRLGLEVTTLVEPVGLRRDLDSVDDLDGLPDAALDGVSPTAPLAGDRPR